MLHRFSLRSLFSVLGCCLFVLPDADAAAADIVGTPGDDLIIVNLTTSTVKVNGAVTDVAGASPINVLANGGDDRIVVFGNPQLAELARFNGKSLTVQDGARVLRVSGGEDLVFRGNDDDRAVLLDSAGSDHLEVTDELTFMDCPTFDYTVRGVKSINVTADRGGTDTVDVRAEEIGRLSTHEDCVRLVPAAGSDFPTTHFLFGFEEVETAHVTSFLFEDTPNDDTLFAFQKTIRWITDDLQLTHRGDYDDLTALSRPPVAISGFDRAVVRLPKQDETRFSSGTDSIGRNVNVRLANVEKLILVQNFAINEFEILPGPSTEDALAVFTRSRFSGARTGSLEDRSFSEAQNFGTRLPEIGLIKAKGFEQFNLNGFFSGVTITDSQFDDHALLTDSFASFEGNNTRFNLDFSDARAFRSENGGVDSALSVGFDVALTGATTIVNNDILPTGRNRGVELTGFSEEIHIAPETSGAARVNASDAQRHRVFATPNDLTYRPPTGTVKTLVGYSTYTVSGAAPDYNSINANYSRQQMNIVYDNENDSSLTQGEIDVILKEPGIVPISGTVFRLGTGTRGNFFRTDTSTLIVDREIFDLADGSLFEYPRGFIEGIDSVILQNP